MSGIILDWNAIRPLNGGRDKGFEELCSQLARCEAPSGARFVRNGTPDAGVECYAVLHDGSEWAWQSKYVDGLGDSQWKQIDESIQKAIEKYPRMVRYFVCVPWDLPDARIGGQRSARDRWNEHVNKWTQWATAKGMSIEFVYWGSHEMIDRLNRPEHVGRVRFWFDKRGFDGAWFSARLDEALRTAGPRYTPEVRVDLPVAREFDAFGRTKRFFDRIKLLAPALREKLRAVESSYPRVVDAEIDTAAATLLSRVQAVLAGIGALEAQPTGALPFQAIAASIESAKSAVKGLSDLLEKRERDHDAPPPPGNTSDEFTAQQGYRVNPFRDRWIRFGLLTAELRQVHDEVLHAARVAGASLLLIRGVAGSGKTHLLCDVARNRIAENQPTVLLMGQRFVSNDAPWTQALQQLDLPGLSAEEFVGALEASAQACGARALLMIDAINEGKGRTIWPSHLEAFLAHAERSAWIGVVLSVRTPYEEIVVPQQVLERAAQVTHQGFMDHEYDATKTFFLHYGLELPSTPLLAPEFRNPLFLKTLCCGLHANGERRLPRGLHGITAIFDLYLSAINKRLARQLNFNPQKPLVRRALDAISAALVDTDERWLTSERASDVVDALLPGRDFELSLYRGLVVEGLLVEEAPRLVGKNEHDLVHVSYERLADHLVAKTLLDRHLDAANPAAAFAAGGALAFVSNREKYIAPGLLEALCMQVAERCSQELLALAPTVAERYGIGDAFRQSLVWRAVTAFSEGTREALNVLCRSDIDLYETLDAFLTVAMLPEHPFNAHFLDKLLRKNAMAERDAWWSIYLHRAWRTRGAVDRLVDWASSVAPNTLLDDEVVELGSTTLTWMLTTSNRFLRDRATQALVCLLTGRPGTVVRLIHRFAGVGDPYVAERVYAVAYGVAMRGHDPIEVGVLAQCVYDRVFSTGSPPPHILLRDYARGVVERSLYLGSQIEVDPKRIRPPYKSSWPRIPSEEDIKPFLADWSKGSYGEGDSAWAHDRIVTSVLDDDFAWYVIGTNSSTTSSKWLSLTLDEAPWVPAPRPQELLQSLLAEFSAEEQAAWHELEATRKALIEFAAGWFDQQSKDGASESTDLPDFDALLSDLEKANPPGFANLKEKRNAALEAFEAVFTEEHAQRLTDIMELEETDQGTPRPPRFDLRQIQRYILWRVFDLGWTTERFGDFDRFSIWNKDRDARKAERIGKKYQWIAYHEILALVSDRFQYREQFREEEGDKAYEGPWQNHLRDIDPSCTLRASREGTSWGGHATAWWGPVRFDAWGNAGSERGWVQRTDDLPKVEDLLVVTNPEDGLQWLNAQGSFGWEQQAPADRESTDVERGELWYSCTGYLIRKDDADIFLKWAEDVDFFLGRWMPDAAEVHEIFLGEHAWAPASHYFERQHIEDAGWTQPDQGCPVKIRAAALKYLRAAGRFDCSVDESFTLRLPVRELVTGLGIRWAARGADFVDALDRLAAQDPTAHAEGPSALLLRRDLLQEFLARENLTICWAVVGEKRILSTGSGGPRHPELHMSGAYMLGEKGLTGFVKRVLYEPGDSAQSPRVISTYRSAT